MVLKIIDEAKMTTKKICFWNKTIAVDHKDHSSNLKIKISSIVLGIQIYQNKKRITEDLLETYANLGDNITVSLLGLW